MLKIEPQPKCMICEHNNIRVKRYIDEVGILVIAHSDCVSMENNKTKVIRKKVDAEWKRFYKNQIRLDYN